MGDFWEGIDFCGSCRGGRGFGWVGFGRRGVET